MTITDLGNAAAANGINVQLDAQEVADLKSIDAYLQAATNSTMIAVPAAAAAKV